MQVWKQLTNKEVTHFIEKGYVVIHEVFPRDLTTKLLPLVWNELEIKQDDSSTWTEAIFMLRKVLKQEPFPQVFSKRYREAVEDLLGAGRWRTNNGVGHWPILLPGFAKPPWQPPKRGWHLDLNLGFNRLNSPDRGLVGMELFTDIVRGGGGTAIRVGSYKYTACIIDKAESMGMSMQELYKCVLPATEHLSVDEAIGQAGDVILIHPFTVHSSSPNTSDRVRIAANRPFLLNESFNLTSSNKVKRSPIEKSIIDAINNPM